MSDQIDKFKTSIFGGFKRLVVDNFFLAFKLTIIFLLKLIV